MNCSSIFYVQVFILLFVSVKVLALPSSLVSELSIKQPFFLFSFIYKAVNDFVPMAVITEVQQITEGKKRSQWRLESSSKIVYVRFR